jgi:hypothetical protein
LKERNGFAPNIAARFGAASIDLKGMPLLVSAAAGPKTSAADYFAMQHAACSQLCSVILPIPALGGTD